MYRALKINTENFTEFKSKLIDYLCINLIWFDVYKRSEENEAFYEIADIEELIEESESSYEDKFNMPTSGINKLNEILFIQGCSERIKVNNNLSILG